MNILIYVHTNWDRELKVICCEDFEPVVDLVYKIPYRRAPRLAYRLHRPLGRVRRASKGILHTMVDRDRNFVPAGTGPGLPPSRPGPVPEPG